MKVKMLDKTMGPGKDIDTGLDRSVRIRVYSDHSSQLVIKGHVDDVWRAYLLAFAEDFDAEWAAYIADKEIGATDEQLQ